jgi:CO/xanthine dehydrogenase FAD-binding subunit
MKYFECVEPKDLDEACRFLSQNEGAKVLAGGASLVVLLKNNLISPSHLVNLKTIPGLDKIEWDDREGLKIGPLNRHRDILSSPLIQKHCSILAEAASKIATPPIRNMGTIGGNLCHAEPSADFPPALIALGAKLKLISSKGERVVPIEKFFVDFYETILSESEILVEIKIPPLPPRSVGTYIKLDKITNSIAIVGIASVISLNDKGSCTFAGVGLGGVGSTPLKVEKAKEILLGKKIEENHINQVAKEAQAISNPITNVYASAEYRKEMVYVLTQKALKESLKRALAM